MKEGRNNGVRLKNHCGAAAKNTGKEAPQAEKKESQYRYRPCKEVKGQAYKQLFGRRYRNIHTALSFRNIHDLPAVLLDSSVVQAYKRVVRIPA